MADVTTLAWTVLVNSEQQYGLYPTDLPIPKGWRDTGYAGTEEECMRHVDAAWTDMRPLSLRGALGPSVV
ncbi:MbtH family NRPS accessory protein [Streptomyces sp. NPDC048484]|uniref:MbtH family protein n=1 Tax=Streptomyces sp. NPDC048484 TaxID=3155146 RepID=UPI003429878B